MFQIWMAGIQSHLAFILSICYVCYALNCDLTKIRGKQLELMMDAAGEGLCNAGGAWVSCFAGGSEKRSLRRDGGGTAESTVIMGKWEFC